MQSNSTRHWINRAIELELQKLETMPHKRILSTIFLVYRIPILYRDLIAQALTNSTGLALIVISSTELSPCPAQDKSFCLPAPLSWGHQTPPGRQSQMGTAVAPRSWAGWKVPPQSSAGVSQSVALCVPIHHAKKNQGSCSSETVEWAPLPHGALEMILLLRLRQLIRHSLQVRTSTIISQGKHLLTGSHIISVQPLSCPSHCHLRNGQTHFAKPNGCEPLSYQKSFSISRNLL